MKKISIFLSLLISILFILSACSQVSTPSERVVEQRQQQIQDEEGAQGEQGLQGEEGALGEQGLQGEQGAQGEQGIPGPQGPEGPMGPQGPEGPMGPQGIQGVQGLPGEPGAEYNLEFNVETIPYNCNFHIGETEPSCYTICNEGYDGIPPQYETSWDSTCYFVAVEYYDDETGERDLNDAPHVNGCSSVTICEHNQNNYKLCYCFRAKLVKQ